MQCSVIVYSLTTGAKIPEVIRKFTYQNF